MRHDAPRKPPACERTGNAHGRRVPARNVDQDGRARGELLRLTPIVDLQSSSRPAWWTQRRLCGCLLSRRYRIMPWIGASILGERLNHSSHRNEEIMSIWDEG